MNILQINKFHWQKGGSETVYLGLLELLEQHGHSVVPFSMADEHNLASDYSRFFVDHVSYDGGSLAAKISAAGKIIYSFDARNKMRQLLQSVSPDIAHFHIFQHQISPSVFGPLKKRGIPLVLTLHDLKPICPNYKMLVHGSICERCKGRRFYYCLLNRCSKGGMLASLINTVEMYFHYAMGYYQSVDMFTSVSRFYRDKMIEFGFPETKVVHIPNFIDSSRYPFSAEDRGYGLYLGRLSEEKGLSTLLHALSQVPEVPFYLVGTGPLEAELKLMARDLGLRNLTFCGFQTGAALRQLIQESSFTVIPSEWYENCPMSILESLATGKPVLGSRIGGIPELIDEGRDGLTFEPGDRDDLADKIRVLWRDSAMRASMGVRGREKIEQEYSPEKYYRATLAVYDQVLGKRRH